MIFKRATRTVFTFGPFEEFLKQFFQLFFKRFVKAGKPGWAAIVPIYNLVVLMQIAGRPLWWIVLFFVPMVNLIMLVLVGISVAEKFGKGAAYGIGLALLGFVFYPMLGFSDAQYQATEAA